MSQDNTAMSAVCKAVSVVVTWPGEGAVDVHEMRASDHEHDCDDDKCPNAGDRLGAKLSPGEADHGATPTSSGTAQGSQ